MKADDALEMHKMAFSFVMCNECLCLAVVGVFIFILLYFFTVHTPHEEKEMEAEGFAFMAKWPRDGVWGDAFVRH